MRQWSESDLYVRAFHPNQQHPIQIHECLSLNQRPGGGREILLSWHLVSVDKTD